MAYPKALQYIKDTKAAPLSAAERAYALQLHGAATIRRVANLFDQILCSRVDGYHGNGNEHWLRDGRLLIETELSSAVRDELLSEQAQQRGLAALRTTLNPDGLLELLLQTRSAVDGRRRKKAMSTLTNKDKVILLQEENA